MPVSSAIVFFVLAVRLVNYLVAPAPEIALGEGRGLLRVAELLALADLVERLRKSARARPQPCNPNDAANVKELISGQMLAFIEQQHVSGKPIRARELAAMVQAKFSVEVHPRTIECALTPRKTPR